jgi:hypothetical protein
MTYATSRYGIKNPLQVNAAGLKPNCGMYRYIAASPYGVKDYFLIFRIFYNCSKIVSPPETFMPGPPSTLRCVKTPFSTIIE